MIFLCVPSASYYFQEDKLQETSLPTGKSGCSEANVIVSHAVGASFTHNCY